jgi:hypothetical protein
LSLGKGSPKDAAVIVVVVVVFIIIIIIITFVFAVKLTAFAVS